MAITKFTGADNNIRGLSDRPEIPAADLKAKFDQVGSDVKTYINDTLTKEIDDVIETKSDKSNTYTKTEVDNQLSGKVDKVQGKSLISDEKISKLDRLPAYPELELSLFNKVDKENGKTLIDNERLSKLDDLPTNTELTNTLNTKSDKSNTYTKTEVDVKLSSVYKFKGSKTTEEINALTDMQDGDVYNVTNSGIIQPNILVMPGDNVAWVENESKWDVLAQVIDLSQYYTKSETDNLLYGKVDVEAGKGLSSEDYTTQEKTKLSGIESGAEVNVLEGVQINGTDLSVSNKKVNIPNATNEGAGVVKGSYDKGIIVSSDGTLEICEALGGNIDLREHYYPITPYNLDYAVRSVRPVISHDVGGTLLVNTIYDIGTQASLTLTLPTNPEYGDFVQVDLLTGENPLNLTVESALGLADVDFTPDTNKIYSLFFDYGRIGSDLWGWRFSYAEYQDSEV